MIDAYVRCIRNYANFKGRSTRSDYWYAYLANILVGFILGFIGGFLNSPELTSTIALVYGLFMMIPGFALFVRRMHDINKSGWAWLWFFLPFVGWIVVLVFLCTKSVNEGNKYGSLEDAPVADVTTEENV